MRDEWRPHQGQATGWDQRVTDKHDIPSGKRVADGFWWWCFITLYPDNPSIPFHLWL